MLNSLYQVLKNLYSTLEGEMKAILLSTYEEENAEFPYTLFIGMNEYLLFTDLETYERIKNEL